MSDPAVSEVEPVLSSVRRAGTPRHLILLLAAAAAVVVALVGTQMLAADADLQERIKAKGYRRSGIIEAAVVRGAAAEPLIVPAAVTGFTPQARFGYRSGDGWEPAIAADRLGHVYGFYAQYLGVPGCEDCFSPTGVLQISDNRGETWGSPRPIYRAGADAGQWDPQIVVDPVDGRTVYAAWLQNGKSDIAVAKSTDFGRTWTVKIANGVNKGTDKPILAVRGRHVYVAYNHATQMYVASSHDRGATWSEVKINHNAKLGWALAGGGTVDTAGRVYFSWAGYEQNGVAKGPVNLFISKSADRGASWTHKVLDVSGAPPDCSADSCGWAYLGAQVTMTSDADGTLYALWNSGTVENGAERAWYSRSTNAGQTWSAKKGVSSAPARAHHAFPAITARGSGDVRISWMDTRAKADNSLWNTYYRSSTNAGSAWSGQKDISSPTGGAAYIKANGFEFPFGDYYELDIDDEGTTQVVMGEGLNYDTPGAIWYTRGR
ncbi:MAG: sialidase family protein [Candidatus Limnocylindrales bacterium]